MGDVEIKNLVIVVLAMLVTVFSYLWRKKKRIKTNEDKDFNKQALSKSHSNADLMAYHERENDILLRIAEADRELSAKLDTKISLLNVLIEKADNKIMELKGLQGSSRSSEQAVLSKELPKQEQLHAKVRDLKKAGLSSSEIANHLKMMEGEVNLILSILKKTQNE